MKWLRKANLLPTVPKAVTLNTLSAFLKKHPDDVKICLSFKLAFFIPTLWSHANQNCPLGLPHWRRKRWARGAIEPSQIFGWARNGITIGSTANQPAIGPQRTKAQKSEGKSEAQNQGSLGRAGTGRQGLHIKNLRELTSIDYERGNQ